MGHPSTNTFTILMTDMNAAPENMADLRRRIIPLVEAAEIPGGEKMLDSSMSRELEAGKGSVVVIAGVWNYWSYQDASKFAKAVSGEFNTWVYHLWHEHTTDRVEFGVWDGGEADDQASSRTGWNMAQALAHCS